MGLFDSLFGNDEQKKANQIAQAAQLKRAKEARSARRIAVRTAQADRKAQRRQTAAMVKAERRSAEMLAAIGKEPNRTEFIDDEEAARKKLLAMSGGRSAYGFARPPGMGLGGGMTSLG